MSDDPALAMAALSFRDVNHEGNDQYPMSGSDLGPNDSASNVSAGGKSIQIMLQEQLEAAHAEIASLKKAKPVPVITVLPNPKEWLSAISQTGMFIVKFGSKRYVAFDRTDTFVYINLLRNHFALTAPCTYTELFTSVRGTYPRFQDLLDAVPVPMDLPSFYLNRKDRKHFLNDFMSPARN